MSIERRIFDTGSLTIENRKSAAADNIEIPTIRGYAAVFNSVSQNLGGFREQIMPGAFDDVLVDDVRALFNHDPNHVLGRTVAGTMRLGIDAKGLYYEVDLPDTQTARDLLISVKRGDVTQSSFAFSVAPGGAEWTEDDTVGTLRSVTKVARLYDVSPVTYPAYADATVASRSLEEFKQQKSKKSQEIQEKIEKEREIRERKLKIFAY